MANKLNSAVAFKLGKFLEQNMERVDGGCAVYKDGWDDDKVAAAISSPEGIVNANNVAGLRRALFGHFPTKQTVEDIALAARVASLEGCVAGLQEQVLELREKLAIVALLPRVADTNFPQAHGDPSRLVRERG
jgi:hypothetical protein